LRDRLMELTPTPLLDLQAAWDAAANPELAALTEAAPPPGIQVIPE
jgi:hypothetical protein